MGIMDRVQTFPEEILTDEEYIRDTQEIRQVLGGGNIELAIDENIQDLYNIHCH